MTTGLPVAVPESLLGGIYATRSPQGSSRLPRPVAAGTCGLRVPDTWGTPGRFFRPNAV